MAAHISRKCLLCLALAVMAGGARGAWAAELPRRVLVLPLAPMTSAQEHQWIGPAAQQNIVSDLGQISTVAPVVYKTENLITSTAVAGNIGRANDGRYVVTGAFQVVDVRVRLTAQVVDTQTDTIVGTAKATGFLSELLKVEDDLAGQVRGVLQSQGAPPAAAVGPAQVPMAQGVPGQVSPGGPMVIVVQVPAPPAAPAYPPINYPPYDPGYIGLNSGVATVYTAPYLPYYPGFRGYGHHGYDGYGYGYNYGFVPTFPPMRLVSSTHYHNVWGTVMPTGSHISTYGPTPSSLAQVAPPTRMNRR